MPEQKAIAHILRTLDDKIELNRRMNQTLEAMARPIFQDWFVDFGPVRAKMEGEEPYLPPELWDLFPDDMVDSELGEIPRGWEVKELRELAVVSSGKRPSLRIPTATPEATVPIWGGNGPMAYTEEPLIYGPILLTGRVGTLGSVFRITGHSWPSDNALVIRVNDTKYFDCLFFHMEQIDFESLNRGSTQPLLAQKDLLEQLIIWPTSDLIDYFHETAHRFTEFRDAVGEESLTLSCYRDALVPKLVSGQARVGTRDIGVD